MMRILISAANSDISIAIARIVRLSYPKSTIIGVVPDGFWPAKNFYEVVEPLPFANDEEGYRSVLQALVNKHKVDLFLPISEKELALFASSNAPNINAKMLTNPNILVETCLDKYKTYTWLKEIGVSVPETYCLDEIRSFDWPVIIKPKKSAGSKNMYSVNSQFFLGAICQELSDKADQYIVQRQVSDPDQEYTCALWRHGNDFRSLILHRKLQGGLTGEAKVVQNNYIDEALNKIQKNIVGDFFINVQLRLENGQPFIFEINPRFSSTVMMRHKIGFQDLVWSVNAKLNSPIPAYRQTNVGTQIYRVADELIVYNHTKEEQR